MSVHRLQVPPPAVVPQGEFSLGTAGGPGRPTIGVNSQSLLRDGRPWLGVMGEVHYSRLPECDWLDALLKMKAGGLDVIASYIFWIHHEEVEGQWDWSGQRNLRRFIELCDEVGLALVLRCGPWCHGEVRNGGLPDWVLGREFEARSLDAKFMHYARLLYEQIAEQAKGLLWKDGGPIVGLQVDNEYGGPGEYLMALRQIAIDCGMDVPLYIRTGWPTPATPLPFGQLLPLYGAYAEGFWSRELEAMPGHYWKAFCFEIVRTDVEVGADMLGKREATNEPDTAQYPYLTCEIGGGMEQSYHRRVRIDPRDVYSVTLTKVGSGSTLPGYYMYHGGRNPAGKRTTLQESQATKYHNDSPTLNYDFQAPLGQWGQVRPHFHMLRRLHTFLADFGETVATMATTLPAAQPTDKRDSSTLRWSLRQREDGQGLVFVNNYQRLMPMGAKEGVQFEITKDGRTVTLPTTPTTVPADKSFFLPVGLRVWGLTLAHATAQVLCKLAVDDGDGLFVFQVGEMPVEMLWEDEPGLVVEAVSGIVSRMGSQWLVSGIAAGSGAAVRLRRAGARDVVVYVLSEADALASWKVECGGRQRLLICAADMVMEDGGGLRVQTATAGALTGRMYPAPAKVVCGGAEVAVTKGEFVLADVPVVRQALVVERVRAAGPVRQIKAGYAKVAEAPGDADFEAAAVYKIKLPAGRRGRIAIDYVGDVARLYAGRRLLNDHFYNGGLSFDTTLVDVTTDELELRILPLQKGAPIYMAPDAWPDFGGGESFEAVRRVEMVVAGEVALSA